MWVIERLLPRDLPIADICYINWEAAVAQKKTTEFLRGCIFETPATQRALLPLTFSYHGLQASMAGYDALLPIQHEAADYKAGYIPPVPKPTS